MNSKLKTLLKVAAAAVVPGALVFLVLDALVKDSERKEFRKYVHKTYGEGSKYVDNYN